MKRKSCPLEMTKDECCPNEWLPKSKIKLIICIKGSISLDHCHGVDNERSKVWELFERALIM